MDEDWKYIVTYILLAVLVILAFEAGTGLVAKAIVSPDRAVRALTDQGFTNVQITGVKWMFVGIQGCDSGDSLKFLAKATNPIGIQKDVYVCSGIFKGATIRTQ